MSKHKCPVCGKYEFSMKDSLEICPECKWQDDMVQEEDPEYSGGANDESLNQAKENYQKHGVSKLKWLN